MSPVAVGMVVLTVFAVVALVFCWSCAVVAGKSDDWSDTHGR